MFKGFLNNTSFYFDEAPPKIKLRRTMLVKTAFRKLSILPKIWK